MDTIKYVKLKEPCFLEFVTEGKSVNEAILYSKCTKYFDVLMINTTFWVVMKLLFYSKKSICHSRPVKVTDDTSTEVDVDVFPEIIFLVAERGKCFSLHTNDGNCVYTFLVLF